MMHWYMAAKTATISRENAAIFTAMASTSGQFAAL
jgi:hypothetical protein